MSEAELAEAVRHACAGGEPLLVQGAGTKACMLRPVQAARVVSTRGLRGFSLYAPKELVFSAAAGTPIAEIEAALAREGQHLIAEPPDYTALLGAAPDAEQTLGGIVATNLSGPRRIAWGATRDHVLGLRFIDGSGQLIRAGGRVLKNVTGLDLCKLLTGSHGTLGIITEATLKVLPAPEASGSVLLRGLDPLRGVAALSEALGSPYSVTGAAYLPEAAAALLPEPEGCALTIMRIEELGHSVSYRIGRLRQVLAAYGEVHAVEDDASRALWSAIRHARILRPGPADAVWRISVRPSRGPGLLAAAIAAGATGYLDWGGGLAMLAGPATDALHAVLTTQATNAGGVWTVLRGPEAWRASCRVLPPEPPALAAIARRVKAAMDPRGILNPGRMIAGL